MASVRIPTIIERTPRGERAWDLFSRLLQERVIMLGTPIDEEVAVPIVAQLLFLQHSDPERDIWFYINSPGGSVRDGLAIYDTMQLISPDVNTVCIGMAGSMATVLLTGGAPGKRYALPNAKVMIHQPWGGFRGQASDIEIHAREMLATKKRLNEILAKHTGQSLKTVEKDTDRDNFMTAEEAKRYGLIDQIIEPEGKPLPSAPEE